VFIDIEQISSKGSRQSGNAVTIPTLSILLSSFLLPNIHIDNISDQIYTLNIENNLTQFIPFPISLPAATPEAEVSDYARNVRITAVKSEDIESGQRYTHISELSAYGKSSSSSPPSTLYDDFQSGTYSMSDGQTSPNSRWHNFYNGGGSSGVQNDGTGNNVFYMYPRTSTSPGQTYASAVETTQKFSSFELSLDVKTVKQLRQNSPPNAWEAATIFFRHTDTWHYYAFVVKPNGIEFDKKDCNTCTDPVEGQQFLVTAGSPTLKIGSWSNWKITAIGNHITITVDGNKIIDYIDNTMSSKLGSGSMVLYNEDALAHFDNVKITPK
jgi:3-keto-disaccharide hydrolase